MHPSGPSADSVAISLSAACLVHCLILPVAAGFLPTLGLLSEAEWLHGVLVAMAAPVSLTALWRTNCRRPLTWLMRGLAVFGLGLLAAGAAGWPAHEWETLFTVAGALVLVATHTANFIQRHAHGNTA